jgi:methyltransferase
MRGVFWVLFSYCVVERVAELFISRGNRAQMQRSGFIENESKLGLTSMIVLHAAWYVAMCQEVIFRPSEILPIMRYLVVGAFVVAQALRFWTLSSLGGFWNISVMTKDTTREMFVSSGPYRYIRHPNYLVVIVEILALPLAGGAVLTAVVFTILNAVLLARRIKIEEGQLFLIPGYRDAMGAKNRFLPKLFEA